MDQFSPDRSRSWHWLIYESGGRWIQAARRFAPELVAPPLAARIDSIGLDVELPLRRQDPAVLLWEVDSKRFVAVGERIIAVSQQWPLVMHLVAVIGLNDRERMLLSELGASFLLDHPESLPRAATLFRAHFARRGLLLD